MKLVILYRILQTATPTRWDFMAHAERGTEPRTRLSDLAEIEWQGISTYDTIGAASEAAREFRLGTQLAELAAPEDGRVAIAQALRAKNRNHFTLWAEPEMLMTQIVRVVPVDTG